MNEVKTKKIPSFGLSLLVFLSIIGLVIITMSVLKIDVRIAVVLSLVLVGVVSSLSLKHTFEDLLAAMTKSVGRAIVALLIFILIGTIIGTWMAAGTIPALMYYGLKIITPGLFLPLGLILCSVTSMATGTSWGTVGTVGVALMGMGIALGIPAPIIAGMVVSGALFGDKMSPISDTTNLAAVTVGANLYDHIKAMSMTTVPAYIIAFIIYTVIGLKYASGNADGADVDLIQNTLAGTFNMNPLVLLPMVVLLTLSLLRVHAVPAMVVATAVGIITAMIFQGLDLAGALASLTGGTPIRTDIALVDNILRRGGIDYMMWTFSLTFIALCLGGILEDGGYLKALIKGFIEKINNIGVLVTTVIFSTFISTAAMSEVYLGIILNGNLYKKAFEERNLRPEMLSRLVEEGGTLTGALMPWTTAGAFIAGTLGVETFAYVPYAYLSLINPLLSIVLSFLGIFVLYKKKEQNDKTELI